MKHERLSKLSHADCVFWYLFSSSPTSDAFTFPQYPLNKWRRKISFKTILRSFITVCVCVLNHILVTNNYQKWAKSDIYNVYFFIYFNCCILFLLGVGCESALCFNILELVQYENNIYLWNVQLDNVCVCVCVWYSMTIWTFAPFFATVSISW